MPAWEEIEKFCEICGTPQVVMMEHLGRELLPEECVHHINGDKADNRIKNLELTTKSAHMADHVRSDRLTYLAQEA